MNLPWEELMNKTVLLSLFAITWLISSGAWAQGAADQASDRGFTVQSAVRSPPIVVVLPFCQTQIQVRIRKVAVRPKFNFVGFL